MKISYRTILSNQNFVPELFSDIRWQELDIDQKKEIIYPIFHIKNWRQLNPEYRIYFLQEVENINASMQKRNACKLIQKDNMEGSVHTGPEGSGEIYINSNYVLNGRKYHCILGEDGTNTFEEENLENENARNYIRILDEKSQRLKQLTEDLVEVSKITSGNVHLEMQTIDMVELIYQTGGEFNERFIELL